MKYPIPGFRWFIAVLLFLGTALSFYDRQVFSVLAPEVMRDLGMDNAQYADVAAAFLLSYTVMFALGGRFLDWVGTRLGMLLAVSVWTVASAAHALARTPFQLAAGRFVLGLGEGSCFPGVTKAAVEWFPLKQRSRAIGFAIGGAAIGAVFAPPLTVWLTNRLSWRGAFLATGAMGAVWVFLWAMFYRLPRHSPFVSDAEAAEIDGPAEAQPGAAANAMVPLVRLLSSRTVWGLMLTRFLLDPVFYLYMFWIPQYLSQAHSATLADIGKLTWIPFLTLDISNFLGGWISDWLVRSGWTPSVARRTVMGVAACLTPISIFSMFAQRMEVAVLLMGVLMFAHGFWITNYITLTGDVVPQRSLGTVVGLCGCAGGVSGYLTTRLVGRIVDAYSFVPVFVVAGVMYPLGFLVILLTVRAGRFGEAARKP